MIGLSWVNHVDTATLSASDEAGDLAIANVANPIVGRRWRTTVLTSWGQADFGTDKTVGMVALRFPRDTAFPTSGTITHAFDADGGTPGNGAAHSSGAVSIGAVDGYGYHIYIPASAVTARYWRATFNASGVSFIDTGRMWAGEMWQPTFGIAFGYGDGWDDLSRISIAPRSGAEFIDHGPKQRGFAFALNALSESEAGEIREMQRIAGVSDQVLFVKDTDSPAQETVLGRLAQSTPILHPDFPIRSKAFTLRESL